MHLQSDFSGSSPCAPPKRGMRSLRAELAEVRVALERETAARKRIERALLDAADAEQQRLAQRLHDTVCQSFSGSQLFARALARKFQRAYPEGASDLAELGEALKKAAADLHGLEWALRPAEDNAPSLISALAGLARTTSGRVACEVDCAEPVTIADPFLSRQLLRIAQEAVECSLTRTGVERIDLRLSESEEGFVTLEICDDGESDTAEFSGEHFSVLERVRQRANVIGAKITVTNPSPRSTTLLCQLPPLK